MIGADAIRESLDNLDQLLLVQIAKTESHGIGLPQQLRGLCLSAEEAGDALVRSRTSQRASECGVDQKLCSSSFERMETVKKAFRLSEFESDVLLIALAPEIDSKYERVFGFLHDDLTRRRPTIGLILALLSSSFGDRLLKRERFDRSAPLIRHELLRIVDDADASLSCAVQVDQQITSYLLGVNSLPARLADNTDLVLPAEPEALIPNYLRGLARLIRSAKAQRKPLIAYLRGPNGSGKKDTAIALASAAGCSTLVSALSRAANSGVEFGSLLRTVRVESWVWDSIRFFHGLDRLSDSAQFEVLLTHLASESGVVLLSGTGPWHRGAIGPLGVLTVDISLPDWEERHEEWLRSTAIRHMKLCEESVDALAVSFRLTRPQIRDAVEIAANRIAWLAEQDAEQETLTELAEHELFTAARAQSGHELAALARQIEPAYQWADLVLPSDARTQLEELCRRVTRRHTVLSQWGFGQRHSNGKGANALFAGGSGTGKTMAAEVIASELGLNLYKIDLAGVVSKYIGETEKNLDRIFAAAATSNAILFFDEADALFGKRSEVRDSHDRYANLEISYLLQKMEEYEGIAILATNLRQNMDDAFVRRLAFSITFPFPDAKSREEIWKRVWPMETPLDASVDFGYLAAHFHLSGGNIRNIALAAAFEAADSEKVSMREILHGVCREYQKLGKPLSETDLPPLAGDAERVA